MRSRAPPRSRPRVKSSEAGRPTRRACPYAPARCGRPRDRSHRGAATSPAAASTRPRRRRPATGRRRRRPGLRASAARVALAVRRRWTTCSRRRACLPASAARRPSRRRKTQTTSAAAGLPALAGSPPAPAALRRPTLFPARAPFIRKGREGAAGARAPTSPREVRVRVLSDPSPPLPSARPKPQEMLPMSVVSDMVDDGALSGALMSFVGVSSCGAAIAGARAQGECGQPGVAADASPRKDCAATAGQDAAGRVGLLASFSFSRQVTRDRHVGGARRCIGDVRLIFSCAAGCYSGGSASRRFNFASTLVPPACSRSGGVQQRQ